MDVRVGPYRKLSNGELMLLNSGIGEYFWYWKILLVLENTSGIGKPSLKEILVTSNP